MISYLVPDCPHCGSGHTGRYIEYHGTDEGDVTASHMRKGELVVPSYTDHTDNLYCEECGFEWTGTPRMAWVTRKELKKLKEKKGISDKEIHAFEELIPELNSDYQKLGTGKKRINMMSRSIIRGFIWKQIDTSVLAPLKDIIPKKKDYDFT